MTKVGLFGIGLDTYWGQFEGLLENLEKYQRLIKEKIESFNATVVDAGMVDNPQKAREAADLLKSEDVEIVFLYISTYALSSTVLPIAQKIKVPIVLLNLQPVPQLDYDKFNALNDRGKMTGVWLEHCQACSVPEIASVFNRSGIRYDIVTGFLGDDKSWSEIEEWVDASRVTVAMRNNRLGVLGHYYGGMLRCVHRPHQTKCNIWYTHRNCSKCANSKIIGMKLPKSRSRPKLRSSILLLM